MSAARLAALLLALAAPATGEDAASLPGWLAGCWHQEDSGRWTEECWTAPRGGIMLGSGRSGTGDGLRSWETMQIELDTKTGTLTFFGAPSGQGRTAFAGRAEAGGITFVNPAHDYPQRIHYHRDGPLLIAEVSLLDGSNPSRWVYRRAE